MKIPYHIAVIMDGNGRWAKMRGLPRVAGHKKGMQRVLELIDSSQKLGVKILTVFAFSTENWNRSKDEVSFIFSYGKKFFIDYRQELVKRDIKFNVIGRRDRIKKDLLKHAEEVEQVTCNNKSFIFNAAVDYGGRWDVINAVKNIIKDFKDKKILDKDLDEEKFSTYLALGDIPDPDLMIRTSGEQRISNFLIWNLAYSELYFTPTLWPDFDEKELLKAIKTYSQRDRRFGEAHE